MNKPACPPELKHKIELLSGLQEKTLASVMGIEFISFNKDQVKASMPVSKGNQQPFGLLHGGASVVLAESLASIGAWLNIDEKEFAAVGVEINANHIRSARKGRVIGTATSIHKGRKLHVWDIRIENEEGKLISVSRCTLAIVPLMDLS